MELLFLIAQLVCPSYAMNKTPTLLPVRRTAISKGEQDSQALQYLQHKRSMYLLQLEHKFPKYEDRLPYLNQLLVQERSAVQNLALVYEQSQLDRHVAQEKEILKYAQLQREQKNLRDHQQLIEVATNVLTAQLAAQSAVQSTEQNDGRTVKKSRVTVYTKTDHLPCSEVSMYDTPAYQEYLQKRFFHKHNS